MPKFKEHVKYKISRQNDGSYVILKKDMAKNKVDIHSQYDTYEDANDALIDLYHKPSQLETMEFLSDLKEKLSQIKKGKPSNRRGVIFSEETKAKMRASHLKNKQNKQNG